MGQDATGQERATVRGEKEGGMTRTPLLKTVFAITEKEWQSQVVELARHCGWKRIYHTFDSRRSAFGFPDLVMVRERVLYVELKTEKGKLSPSQEEWIEALAAAGSEVYCWRPSNFDEAVKVLSRRVA